MNSATATHLRLPQLWIRPRHVGLVLLLLLAGGLLAVLPLPLL